MRNRDITKKINSVIVLLFLAVIPLRYINYHYNLFSYNPVICIFLTIADLLWMYQIERRVTHPVEKRYMIFIAFLNLFLIMIRTFKYIFVDNMVLLRILWYAYYIPVVFSALLMFGVVYYVGKPYDFTSKKVIISLLIPTEIICIGILTNDFHQLMFRFDRPYGSWSDKPGEYHYGILFYITLIWTVLLIILSIIALLKKCMISENRKKFWMPLLPFAGCNILLWFVNLYPDIMAIKMPEIHCFMYPAIMEGLILAGLIPSNEKHIDLWRISSIDSGAMDQNNHLIFREDRNIPVTGKQVKEAMQKPLNICNGRKELRSCAVPGGYAFWVRDVSDLAELRRKLEEAGDVLKEEHSILKAEREIEEQRVKYQKENRLYDSIADHVSSQLEEINSIIHEETEDDDVFIKNIKYACILNAYIKRYSNMIITGEKGRLQGEELKIALSESMEYINLYGVLSHAEYNFSGSFPSQTITAFYTVFEMIIEEYVKNTRAVLLTLKSCNEKIIMYVELDGKHKKAFEEKLNRFAKQENLSFFSESEDNTVYFHIGSGGDDL